VQLQVLDVNTPSWAIADMLRQAHSASTLTWPLRIRRGPSRLHATQSNDEQSRRQPRGERPRRDAAGRPPLIRTAAVELDHTQASRHPQARAGRFVCLSLADTGCGMDAARSAASSSHFSPPRKSAKGSGLGLATVYGIVAQQEGWIEVSSRMGRAPT